MHKKPRSIILHRETLRRLDPRELGKAAAGFSLGGCNTNTTPVTRCGDQCPT
jgi:hypothetical protein